MIHRPSSSFITSLSAIRCFALVSVCSIVVPSLSSLPLLPSLSLSSSAAPFSSSSRPKSSSRSSSSFNMAWTSSSASNNGLIDNMVRNKLLYTPALIAAFRGTDRIYYAHTPSQDRSTDRDEAYGDHPVPIGDGATISAPHMHAIQLEKSLEGGKIDYSSDGFRFLDVGSGSGYLLAVMSRLATSDKARIIGIEHMKSLVDMSIKNLQNDDKKLMDKIKVVVGDGRQGYAAEAPYDIIHVGAAAPTVPDALLQQLKVGGRMLIPVGTWDQVLKLIVRTGEKEWKTEEVCGVRFVPLTDKEKQEKRG